MREDLRVCKVGDFLEILGSLGVAEIDNDVEAKVWEDLEALEWVIFWRCERDICFFEFFEKIVAKRESIGMRDDVRYKLR